ncbi:MAG TPA: NAD(P)-binding protein [Stellaceae bacterium]|nr:NAD(P)-binding protein [Stellaceae bacterium]
MAERNFRVVVAGAGVSGLFMAETLKRAGIDFTVYEKAGEVGGTWRDNTFPGLFVDVLSRQYEFPFQLIMRLISEARVRRAAVAPTAAATEKFLARLGGAFRSTVCGGCKNWYTSDQPTPVLWPLPQSEHKAFLDRAPTEDFQFIPVGAPE